MLDRIPAPGTRPGRVHSKGQPFCRLTPWGLNPERSGLPPRFGTYVALGDSMSIDLYPALDLSERRGIEISGAGAASLLWRNLDDLWPEFTGCDLHTASPTVRFIDLAADGGTTGGVLEFQLPALEARAGPEPVLVTVTAGGNDLLGAIDASTAEAERTVQRALSNLDRLVDRLSRMWNGVTIVLTTVYDPTDGTGRLDDVHRPELLDVLGHLNEGVRTISRRRPACRLADLHAHFLGHGAREPTAPTRWYWERSIIEPNARGASEIRRVWLDAIR